MARGKCGCPMSDPREGATEQRAHKPGNLNPILKCQIKKSNKATQLHTSYHSNPHKQCLSAPLKGKCYLNQLSYFDDIFNEAMLNCHIANWDYILPVVLYYIFKLG